MEMKNRQLPSIRSDCYLDLFLIQYLSNSIKTKQILRQIMEIKYRQQSTVPGPSLSLDRMLRLDDQYKEPKMVNIEIIWLGN